MLEAFEILTTSGVVLWSKSYAPVGSHVINSLINDVFIEEKVVPQSTSANGALPVFKKEKYTLKWKRVKEFNLIFVVRLVVVACRMFSRPSGLRESHNLPCIL
jgi:signal recognition particle receptor subunit alpha